MFCHFQRNVLPHITNNDSIAGVDYLKVKNDIIHCKTIISDRSLIHAAPNFFAFKWLDFKLRHNNLLHITEPGYKGWRKE